MKIAAAIARYLLGLVFTVFGLNGFLHFLPQQPPSSPLAMQFMTVMSASHYLVPVFLIQLVGGVLLLAGRYVPLALTLLAPIIMNILIFHSMMDPANIGPGAVATLLWILLFIRFRSSFAGILQANPQPQDLERSGGSISSEKQPHKNIA